MPNNSDTISIICPSCHAALRIKNIPGIENKMLTCPKCSYRSKVLPFIELARAMEENRRQNPPRQAAYQEPSTQIYGGYNGETSTQIYSGGGESTQLFGAGNNMQEPPTEVVGNGNTHGALYWGHSELTLRNGDQTIGRSAMSSNADIQIAPDDRNMSREHAQISVRNNYGRTQYLIQTMRDQNPIFVNGKRFNKGDIAMLTIGDKIKLGHTELLFERPHFYEDGTVYEG